MKEILAKLKDAKDSDAANEPTPLTMRGGVPARSKINAVQKALRVQQVVTWLLEGHLYGDVVKLATDKWLVSDRQASRYIADAREQMEAFSASEIQSATTLALYRLTELYVEAMRKDDFKTALDVVKTSNRMLGLNAPDKIDSKVSVENWDSMSVAEQLGAVGKIIERGQAAKRNVN